MDGRLTVFVWEPAELSWDEHAVADRECSVCLEVEVLAEGVDDVARDTSGSKERTQPASLQVVVANRQTNAYKQRRIKPLIMEPSEQIGRREQLRALLRVAKYRPKLTVAIIIGGIFAALLD